MPVSSGPSHPGAVCIVNYKGGVGKTSFTLLLAYYLAQLNPPENVLLVDIDAQCSLSIAAQIDPEILNAEDSNIFALVEPRKWSKIVKTDFLSYLTDVDLGTLGKISIIRARSKRMNSI